MVGIGVAAKTAGKQQKAYSMTDSRPTSADQQHRKKAHEQGPKKPATASRTLEQRTLNNTQHPTARSATKQKNIRLQPDSRARSNKRTALTATTEAPGNPPPRKYYPGPGRHRRLHTNNTTRTTPRRPHTAAKHHAVPYNHFAIPDATGSQYMLLWHQKRACAAQPARTSPHALIGNSSHFGTPSCATYHIHAGVIADGMPTSATLARCANASSRYVPPRCHEYDGQSLQAVAPALLKFQPKCCCPRDFSASEPKGWRGGATVIWQPQHPYDSL